MRMHHDSIRHTHYLATRSHIPHALALIMSSKLSQLSCYDTLLNNHAVVVIIVLCQDPPFPQGWICIYNIPTSSVVKLPVVIIIMVQYVLQCRNQKARAQDIAVMNEMPL